MSGDIGEAVGAILGLALGGIILLRMAAELNSTVPVNLAAWGSLFLFGAVLAAVLLVYGLFKAITG